MAEKLSSPPLHPPRYLVSVEKVQFYRIVVVIIVIVIAIVSVNTIVVVAYQEDHATCVSRIHPVAESALSDTPFLAPATNKFNLVSVNQLEIHMDKKI